MHPQKRKNGKHYSNPIIASHLSSKLPRTFLSLVAIMVLLTVTSSLLGLCVEEVLDRFRASRAPDCRSRERDRSPKED